MSHVLRCSGYDLEKTDIVRAEGCRLVDASGRLYVDFEAGVWCAALGHNPPFLRRAIADQLERVAHIGYRYTSVVVEHAARAVLDVVGFADGRCVFLSSGSEAVEFAVQAARSIAPRPRLLGFADVFLGSYGSSGTKPTDLWHLFDAFACNDCSSREACDPACGRLAAIPFDEIGTFVFEPGCSSGLVRFPPSGPVRAIAERIRRDGGLLVVNEITAGMGRTGAWFGHHHYGLAPDLVAVGKGLGNGYPVSAIAMADGVGARLEGAGFHYAQSHQNDPLGCAVAVAVIDEMRARDLVPRSARVGGEILGKLTDMAERQPAIVEVRGRGMMIAIQLAEAVSSLDVFRDLLSDGLIVGCKPAFNVLRLFPPLVLPEEDVDRLLEALEPALERAIA